MSKRSLKFLFVAVWFLLCSALVASLHAGHLAQWLPDPSLLSQKKHLKWSMQHVLSNECKCSRIVADYLIARGPASEVSESVTWIGSPDAKSQLLIDKGFEVQFVEDSKIQKELPTGVPFLSIHSSKNEGVYLGGYSDVQVKNSTDIQDLKILAHFREGKQISSLPIYGCAVSQKFRNQIDPFALKYSRGNL